MGGKGEGKGERREVIGMRGVVDVERRDWLGLVVERGKAGT